MTTGSDPVLIEASGSADALTVSAPKMMVLMVMVRIVDLRRVRGE